MASIALLALVLLFATGCEKELQNSIQEELNEEVRDALENKESVLNYDGITKENSDKFGEYLSFQTWDDIYRTTTVLEFAFSEDELNEWLTNLQFLSWYEKDKNEIDTDKIYPIEKIATVLNPQGFIKVENILYKDTGSKLDVYIVNETDGAMKVVDRHEIREEKNSCSYTSATDNGDDDWGLCWDGSHEYAVEAQLKYYNSYWTTVEHIKVSVTQWHNNCDFWGFQPAHGYTEVRYSYKIGRNGSTNYVNNGRMTRYNDYKHKFTLASAYDLCYYYVNVTVNNQWNNAQTSISLSL